MDSDFEIPRFDPGDSFTGEAHLITSRPDFPGSLPANVITNLLALFVLKRHRDLRDHSRKKFCAVGRYDSFQSGDFSNLLGKAEGEAADAELTSTDPSVFSANTAIVKVIGHDQKSGAFLSRFFIYGGLLNQEKKGGCVGMNGFIRIEKRNELLYLLIGDKNGNPGKN